MFVIGKLMSCHISTIYGLLCYTYIYIPKPLFDYNSHLYEVVMKLPHPMYNFTFKPTCEKIRQ